MKLTEFLNDDTCQIFLAIIIGIVVCYFIFGSCGTGCSRRDGFSVGGQTPECQQLLDDTNTNEKCGGQVDDTLDQYDYTTVSSDCCNQLNLYPSCRAANEDWADSGPNANAAKQQLATLQSRCIAQGEEVDISQQKIENLKSSMKNMLTKLRPDQVDAINGLSTIQEIIEYGNNLNFKFLILENTQESIRLYENNENLKNIITQIKLMDKFHDVDRDDEDKMHLGNIYKTFKRINGFGRNNVLEKQNIYCNNNTLTIGSNDDVIPGEKYDPLLKIRSTIMPNWYKQHICNEIQGQIDIGEFDSTENLSPSDIINQYNLLLKERINQNGQSDQNVDRLVNNIYDSSANGVFNLSTNSNDATYNSGNIYNNAILTVNYNPATDNNPAVVDYYTDESRMKPQLIQLNVDTNLDIGGIVDEANSDYTIERGDYTVLFMDGLSSLGSPYNNLLAVKGNGNSYQNDKLMSSSCINTYYMNVFYLQYLILRLLFSTDKYLGDDLDIFRNIDPKKRSQDSQERDPLFSDNTTNTACGQTFKDYLVIGMLKTAYVTEDSEFLDTTNSNFINLNDKNGTHISMTGDGSNPRYNIRFYKPFDYIHGTTNNPPINSIDCIEYYDSYDDSLGSYVDFESFLGEGMYRALPTKHPKTNRYRTIDCGPGANTDASKRFKKYYYLREGLSGGHQCQWQVGTTVVGGIAMLGHVNGQQVREEFSQLQGSTGWKYRTNNSGRSYCFDFCYSEGTTGFSSVSAQVENIYFSVEGESPYFDFVENQKKSGHLRGSFSAKFDDVAHYDPDNNKLYNRHLAGNLQTNPDSSFLLTAGFVDSYNPTSEGLCSSADGNSIFSGLPAITDEQKIKERSFCMNSYDTNDYTKLVIDGTEKNYPSKCFYAGFAARTRLTENCRPFYYDTGGENFLGVDEDDPSYEPSACRNYADLRADGTYNQERAISNSTSRNVWDMINNPGVDVLVVGGVIIGVRLAGWAVSGIASGGGGLITEQEIVPLLSKSKVP